MWQYPFFKDTSRQSSLVLFQLMTNFLPSLQPCRQAFKMPFADQLEEVEMKSSCICHNESQTLGYVCSNCLSLQCFQPTIDILRDILKEKTQFRKQV
mmetsp:Transcript_12700/g.21389  ORF Transcript_12700/g.21389 Transcript_12700/m.21389 type:complete len:97 (+) Transcript_12700:757-1047(+)